MFRKTIIFCKSLTGKEKKFKKNCSGVPFLFEANESEKRIVGFFFIGTRKLETVFYDTSFCGLKIRKKFFIGKKIFIGKIFFIGKKKTLLVINLFSKMNRVYLIFNWCIL